MSNRISATASKIPATKVYSGRKILEKFCQVKQHFVSEQVVHAKTSMTPTNEIHRPLKIERDRNKRFILSTLKLKQQSRQHSLLPLEDDDVSLFATATPAWPLPCCPSWLIRGAAIWWLKDIIYRKHSISKSREGMQHLKETPNDQFEWIIFHLHTTTIVKGFSLTFCAVVCRNNFIELLSSYIFFKKINTTN